MLLGGIVSIAFTSFPNSAHQSVQSVSVYIHCLPGNILAGARSNQQLHLLYRISDTSDKDIYIDYIKNKTMTDAVSDNITVKNRFKAFLFLFRFAGIPINRKSTSRVNSVYNAIVIVCFYISSTCLLVDCFVHRHELTIFMKKFRLLMGTLLHVWMHISLRYAQP